MHERTWCLSLLNGYTGHLFESRYTAWLECIKGLGPVSWHFLLDTYGSPFEIYQNRMQLSPQGRVTAHCLELMRKKNG